MWLPFSHTVVGTRSYKSFPVHWENNGLNVFVFANWWGGPSSCPWLLFGVWKSPPREPFSLVLSPQGDCGQAVSWGLCPLSWKHKLSCWRSVRKSHTSVPDNSLLSLEKPFWRKPLKDGLVLVSPMSGPALQVYLRRSTPLRNSARGKDCRATKAMINASFLAHLWSLHTADYGED